jgi:catechol 2,3-dioxygenase-like lactoylglutathione lyase family enzyme
MGTTEDRSSDASEMASVKNVDLRLEVVVLPVSDVDRAKEFYGRLGWRLDADYDSGDDFRVIQFTPPGSGCSVIWRINSATTNFASGSDLASALRRAEAAHGEHEKRTGGQRDANWPDWYAQYMAAEQAGTELPT